MREVDIGTLPLDRFSEVLEEDRYAGFQDELRRTAHRLQGRTLWNVNSAVRGGGVAELLGDLLPYFRGAGIDARWLVIDGDGEFFALTKRIHNLLHGQAEPPLEGRDRELYRQGLAQAGEDLARLVRPGDVVVVHDPQPAGLIPGLKRVSASVVWRCHVGIDEPNDQARMAWDFLRPVVNEADIYVFSRSAYAWEGLDSSRITVIPPSIDAFSTKNCPLDDDTVTAILEAGGILEDGGSGEAVFVRPDGSEGKVSLTATMIQDEPLPPDAGFVIQVSRWDRLKDPIGVLRGFAEHGPPDPGVHLVLAGPGKSSVADDPEEEEALAEVTEAWRGLGPEMRKRIHIACLPMEDEDQNAAIVNALQRRAGVVVQKSLAEGFGLTVAEAMWKERAVVASRVGGIQDQVVDGETGVLVDPKDLEGFGRALTELLQDPERAASMGRAGRERVRERFLTPRQMLEHAALFERLDARESLPCS